MATFLFIKQPIKMHILTALHADWLNLQKASALVVQKNQNGLSLNTNNIFIEPIFQKLWSFASVYKSGIRMELVGGLTLSLVPLEEN